MGAQCKLLEGPAAAAAQVLLACAAISALAYKRWVATVEATLCLGCVLIPSGHRPSHFAGTRSSHSGL